METAKGIIALKIIVFRFEKEIQITFSAKVYRTNKLPLAELYLN